MSSGLFNSTPLHISKVDSFEVSISNWFEIVGLLREDWSFIGSFGKKEFSGDVDIAVLEDSVTNLDLFEEIFKELNLSYKICKGFNQISFGYPFEGQVIQVDLMLTQDLEWSKFIYYSPNLSTGESEFSGIYRNLLLSSLIITESRMVYPGGDYCSQLILRLNEGIVWVKKTFRDETGKLTKLSRIIEESEPQRNVSEILECLHLNPPCLTFEQLWNQVKSPERRNRKSSLINDVVEDKFEQIKERFEKFCKQSKIAIPKYGE